jgi:hypothetical protein
MTEQNRLHNGQGLVLHTAVGALEVDARGCYSATSKWTRREGIGSIVYILYSYILPAVGFYEDHFRPAVYVLVRHRYTRGVHRPCCIQLHHALCCERVIYECLAMLSAKSYMGTLRGVISIHAFVYA